MRKVRERTFRGKFGGRWLKLELLANKTHTKEITKAMTVTMTSVPRVPRGYGVPCIRGDGQVPSCLLHWNFSFLKKDKEPRGSGSEDGQVIGLGTK